MDLFEKQEQEIEEKKFFITRYKRILSLLRIILSSVFGGLGIVFITIGIIGMLYIDKLLVIFLGIGGLFLILSLMFFIIFGKISAEKAYERYKIRINSGKMIYSTNEMSLRIIMLENRVKSLEEEIEILRKNR
ncbi:MAG: hypothetical protein IKP77_07400 [Acholeplasmatales bacterium]|nr:hypothetical protein [Acholeplasmatales bacterium]